MDMTRMATGSDREIVPPLLLFAANVAWHSMDEMRK
jgi:hypothetical protein